MDIEPIAKIIEGLAWPVAIIIILFILRNSITNVITRLKGVEGPAGWKLLFEVRKVGERLNDLEKITGNIYNLTGESLRVREEIFNYVADILKNVSPNTALEMRIELNKYHFQRLGVDVLEVKKMLGSINFYQPAKSESGSFNKQIDAEFIDAILKFQEGEKMRDADGIIGPKTLELLRIRSSANNKPAI